MKKFCFKNWWSSKIDEVSQKKFVYCFVTHAPSKLQNDAFFMLWQYKKLIIYFVFQFQIIQYVA